MTWIRAQTASSARSLPRNRSEGDMRTAWLQVAEQHEAVVMRPQQRQGPSATAVLVANRLFASPARPGEAALAERHAQEQRDQARRVRRGMYRPGAASSRGVLHRSMFTSCEVDPAATPMADVLGGVGQRLACAPRPGAQLGDSRPGPSAAAPQHGTCRRAAGALAPGGHRDGVAVAEEARPGGQAVPAVSKPTSSRATVITPLVPRGEGHASRASPRRGRRCRITSAAGVGRMNMAAPRRCRRQPVAFGYNAVALRLLSNRPAAMFPARCPWARWQ